MCQLEPLLTCGLRTRAGYGHVRGTDTCGLRTRARYGHVRGTDTFCSWNGGYNLDIPDCSGLYLNRGDTRSGLPFHAKPSRARGDVEPLLTCGLRTRGP